MSVECEWVSGCEGECVWVEGHLSVGAGTLGGGWFRHFWQRSCWPPYAAWPSASLPLRLESVLFRWPQGPPWVEAVESNCAPYPLGHRQAHTATLLGPETPTQELDLATR